MALFPHCNERYLWVAGCGAFPSQLSSVCRKHTAQSLWHSLWLQLSKVAQCVLNLKRGSRRAAVYSVLCKVCDYLVRRKRKILILQRHLCVFRHKCIFFMCNLCVTSTRPKPVHTPPMETLSCAGLFSKDARWSSFYFIFFSPDKNIWVLKWNSKVSSYYFFFVKDLFSSICH